MVRPDVVADGATSASVPRARATGEPAWATRLPMVALALLDLAKAFIDLLVSPEAKALFRDKGLDPA